MDIKKYFNFEGMITPFLLKLIHIAYPIWAIVFYYYYPQSTLLEHMILSFIVYIPFRMILESAIIFYSIHESLNNIQHK